MLQPLRRRTWAPRGQTPVLDAWDRHDRLSVVSTVTLSPTRRRLGLYFRWQRENVRPDDLVASVRQLHRQLGRPLTLVWDRYSVHRSAARQLQQRRPRWLVLEWLPAYAPELNPSEQCWNQAKYVDLANFIPQDLHHLSRAVARSIRRQRRNQPLLRSFFQTAQLKL